MPVAPEFKHPDPAFPDWWAEQAVKLGDTALWTGNIPDALTHTVVTGAEIAKLVGQGYEETVLHSALRRANGTL